jgi:hypothetical protein
MCLLESPDGTLETAPVLKGLCPPYPRSGLSPEIKLRSELPGRPPPPSIIHPLQLAPPIIAQTIEAVGRESRQNQTRALQTPNSPRGINLIVGLKFKPFQESHPNIKSTLVPEER